jgi:hypothetical protein
MSMSEDREALIVERDFLLSSLDDLDRELAAGDISPEDHAELRDGYVARAAEVLRLIEQERLEPLQRIRLGWKKAVGVLGVVIVIGAALAVVLASTLGERLSGQSMTGFDPRDTATALLAEARAANFSDPVGAADLYALVLVEDPTNVEALTYRGWTLALAARQNLDEDASAEQFAEAVDLLVEAVTVDPSYADPLCFLGIIQYRFVGDADAARPFVAACLAANPPAEVRDLVQNLADELGVGS